MCKNKKSYKKRTELRIEKGLVCLSCGRRGLDYTTRGLRVYGRERLEKNRRTRDFDILWNGKKEIVARVLGCKSEKS